MDKKTILGLVLIGLILLGYSVYNNRQHQKLQEAKAITDSINMAERARALENAQKFAVDNPVQNQHVSDSIQNETFQRQLSSSLGDHLYNSLSGEEELYTVENEVMVVTFSTKGGRVASVMLKDYKKYNGDPLYLFDNSTAKFNLSFYTKTQQVNTSQFYFTPVSSGDMTLGGEDKGSFTMRLYADSLSYIEYTYLIRPDEYMMDFKINLVGMEGMMAPNQSDILLDWGYVAFQNEKGYKNENNYSTIAYMFPGDSSMEDIGISDDAKSEKREDIKTRIKWVAFKQQFFSSILIANDAFENGTLDYRTREAYTGELKDYHAQLALPYTPLANEYDLSFYFGPNKFRELKQYDLEIQKLVPLGGWLIRWINRLIVIPVFDFLGKYIANYGIIIILLTIFIKLLVFPLTWKSYMSQAKMRAIKPEIDALNEKYPDQKDAMKKQQATMALYKNAGINPMGGCLPMLIQFPFLIAMFRFFPASIELRGESFLWAEDLSSYDSILQLPFEIPFYGSHVSLFTLLAGVAIHISSRISYSQTASSAPQMAGMKFMMLYLMPIMMMVWFNNYSSGLSFYFLISNIITIGQTLGFRYGINEEKLHVKLKESAREASKKPKKKSKFMQRYEDALKQQQEMAKQQQKRKK